MSIKKWIITSLINSSLLNRSKIERTNDRVYVTENMYSSSIIQYTFYKMPDGFRQSIYTIYFIINYLGI